MEFRAVATWVVGPFEYQLILILCTESGFLNVHKNEYNPHHLDSYKLGNSAHFFEDEAR
jgi:hypothetical protein